MNNETLSPEKQQQLLMMMLVQQFQQMAMIGLGKLKSSDDAELSIDLPTAKYAIDTLEMLETYTKGNLPEELRSFLNSVLVNLRLNYADESSKKGK